MDIRGEPTPACLGKQLFAQHVRRGDWVAFPRPGSSPVGPPDPYIDAIVAWTDEGRRSGVLVNTGAAPRTVPVEDWGDGLAKDAHVLRLDSSTGGRVVQEPFSGTVTLNGYGIAVVSTQPCEVE
jgi:hypothetical protein